MTIATARQQGIELFAKAGVGMPQLTAEVLLCHALHCERSYLYAHPEQELREVEWLHYGRYLHERLKGKPTQYITKQQEFFGRMFHVKHSVLIPRPETEHLIEAFLSQRREGRVVDVGTGSGVIAITLALESECRITATDVSADALSVAEQNRGTYQAPVAFVQADLLNSFEINSFDAVVSNPPYIPLPEKSSLAREVRDWEPEVALFAGEKGFDIYEQLIPQAQRVLKPGGCLAMEIGFGQWKTIRLILGGWSDVRVVHDLQDIPRVAMARKPAHIN